VAPGVRGADIALTMARRVLLVIVVLLSVLVLGGTLLRARRVAAAPAVAVVPVVEVARSAGSPARRVPGKPLDVVLPAPVGSTGLDALARLGIRRQLRAEAERQYLDSMLVQSDSILRRWPTGADRLRFVVVAGGAAGWNPRMAEFARAALTAWNPGTLGLTVEEVTDTTQASVVIRWIDRFTTNRTGETSLTWDQSGRIHHATILLALHDTAGEDLPDEALQVVAVHEAGHMLGLPHSARPTDIMYPSAGVATPSERDRFTLRLLYDLPTGAIHDRP
jgi:matrixin